MQNISFSSRIKPLPLKELNKVTGSINSNNAVNHPWTLAESRLAKDVYTTGVIDCSACIITDGQEALLMHLDPSKEVNHAFSQVLAFLRDKLDLKNPNLQAVLIGSKNTKKSQDIYNKFKTLLSNLNIPFSELKSGKTPTSVAYKSEKDTVYISNQTIDKILKKGQTDKDAIHQSFDEVRIADCDEIA